ncbi:hypothetical protein MTP99_003073 [Tenebrio molitor]|nr:hypothetical protein MTP99_003073 [Tenebrio molitor]
MEKSISFDNESLPGSDSLKDKLSKSDDQYASYIARIPSAAFSEEDEESLKHAYSSLKEILPSSEFLTREDSTLQACGLVSKVLDECGSSSRVCGRPIVHPQASDSLTSGERMAREIMGEIFKRATRPQPIRKLKKPTMKSGWMYMEKYIPDFYINDEIFKKITFHENLLVSTFENHQTYPTPVGALSLDIQAARGGPLKYQNKKTKSDFMYPKFLVHLSSQLDFFGHNGGSRITAWVDRDLQTLEEKRESKVVFVWGSVGWGLFQGVPDAFVSSRLPHLRAAFRHTATAISTSSQS